MPWNFKSHLIRKAVQNLDCPMEMEELSKYIPSNLYVGIFKDFAEALYQNDFETLNSLLEKSFARKTGSYMEDFFKEVKSGSGS